MIKLVALDLDNTLYDWVSYFVPAFDAMVESLVGEDGVDEDRLLTSLQRVHQAHGTTEYAFVLSDIDLLHEIEESASAVCTSTHPAIEAFRREASDRLRPYEGVRPVLERFRDEGRTIVAYTDAMATYADSRLEQLDLADLFDELVASEDHALPETACDSLSWLPAARFHERAVARRTPVGRTERKPCPAPLKRLLSERDIEPREAVYVGDSLTRDIALAQAAGVHDVYAAYGRGYEAALWDRLVRVTHWTAEDVARERDLSQGTNDPTWVIREFRELSVLVGRLDRAPAVC